MRVPGCFPWLLAIILYFPGLICECSESVKTRQKRNLYNDQPRISSENGNLIFSTCQAKNIEFKTDSQGKVKINNDDLTDLLVQIGKNKEEIATLKANALGTNQSFTTQISQLTEKITDIEVKVQSLQQVVEAINRKSCSSNPCQNTGTCIDLLDSFLCLCTSRWQGSICAEDVNECQLYDGTALGCHNQGLCMNTPGSYSCSCLPEWYGPQCTSRYDDCKVDSGDLCIHGICVDLDRTQLNQPKFRCICESGWMSPPGSSVCSADINECLLPNPPCSQNPPVQCFNTPGSFTCGTCPEECKGWQGNGYSCQDINECDTNNGGCSVSPPVKCMNTMGSFHCGPCPPGYDGDGHTCTQKDVCSVNNGGCHPLASCAPAEDGVLPICVCPPGYDGNGYGSTGCLPFSDICEKYNPCVNGECKPSVSGYLCKCNSGWNGVNCTDNINECSSNPCQNGGNCTDGINSYACNCTNSWTGFHCEIPKQACGGDLSGLSGTLSYPNNPGGEQYEHLLSCTWVIRTVPDKSLLITFDHFQLEASATCDSQFLEIHDGESMLSVKLGKYCGTNVPRNVVSSHNSLFLWFQSQSSSNAGSFQLSWESITPECGGDISGTYGLIASPGYPGNYPPNRDCYWTISTDPGLSITFSFGTLYLENHNTCENDYLEIRDGLLPQDTVLKKYCTTQSPVPLMTSGPYAWVHFHSDSSMSDRGFQITYTTLLGTDPGCGGTFNNPEGFITSPSWPDAYSESKQCVYIIRQSSSDHINLRFTNLQLESDGGCSLTYIEIKDGATETAPLINKYCNSSIPTSITSSQNALWIKFKSDASATRSSFRALYQVACGGMLSGKGVIKTPLYPNAYFREKTCEWVITQPIGDAVLINFDSFNIQPGAACSSNYVEVRDGPSADSTLIGKYCGPEVPPPAQSTQRALYVKFTTDSSEYNRGFSASFSTIIQGCGGTFTASEGVIASPRYPEVYPHGVSCTWFVSIQPGNFIRLTFTSFNLEHFHGCVNDYLEVYDGPVNVTIQVTRWMARYCGKSVPPTINSSNNRMVLLFVTDSDNALEGFSANYIAVNASTACYYTYTEATGVITSPNYPNNSPRDTECVYTISAEKNKQILLNFTHFTLSSSSNCQQEYVEIRDGGYEISPLIGRFCQQSPPIIISHSNNLWVKFKSGSYTYATGFSANWDSALTGCGGTLSSLSGGFTSPNYPMPYHQNVECYWLLKASSGSILEIKFEDFHLEYDLACQNEYLAVYDGNNTNSHLLAKLCGNLLPEPILSTASNVYVKLRTDNSIEYNGFFATYKQICNGVLIANRNHGILESLNYPNQYPADQHCNWTIQTTFGNTINYTFTTFQLENSYDCSRDYVKLYDGPNDQSRLIGTYCGNTVPPPDSTNSSSLHVVFHSDSSYSQNGFQMLWYVNGCGGELSGPTGSFTSPGYPMKYPGNRECIWYIQTSPSSSIQLTIVDFNIEYHSTCSYDVLEVYGGPGILSPRLAQLCAPLQPGHPLQVSSSGNTITVRFKTDAFVSGRGFNATWHENPGGCGGIFQAPSGEIHSPNYPRPYEDHTECSWVIRVKDGHRVILNFTDFDVEFHNACEYDSVSVYDGENSDAPVLQILCGSQVPSAIISTQNTMFIHLQSDHSGQHRGFSSQFSEACGGVIESDSTGGTISSPLYPANYPNNQNCVWIIRAQEPLSHITLSFTDFVIEDSNRNCTLDYVEILDGDNYEAPTQGLYCGNTIPHPITSYSNALVVKFISDGFNQAKGFHATYMASTSACGGTLHMESGAFNSPNYPEDYPSNTECVWKILSSPGNRLMLSFMTFSLQISDNCTNDYVEVREGNETGMLLGRYCGISLPSNVTTITGHILWIKFVSDHSNSGSGFRATFSHLFGSNIFGTQGQIASPLWPRNYPHHSNYIWTINVESTQIIEARMLEIDIEEHSTCSYDKLQIYDGPNIHYHLLGTYCGVTPPPSLFSSASSMTVGFVSDNSISKKGFLLEWLAIELPSGPLPTIAPGACGGRLITGETPLFFFSPGWPNNYANRLDCTWVIRSPESTVELNILSLDIEKYRSCNYDKLVIKDGDNNESPELATLCGRELPGPIRSSGDSMFIRFTSDSSNSGRGFNASYHKSCGGALQANIGVISSHNYPENYNPNLNCTWHVRVSDGYTIGVEFDRTFEILNNDGTCSSGDYIELRNGPDESSPSLGQIGGNGKFCGSSTPSTMHTTDNELFVRFISDSSNEGKGFKLTYQAMNLACGGTIYVSDSNPTGYIISPNYPNNYPQNSDCIWTIIVQNGESVQLSFQDQFDIQPSESCDSSYLELRDGADFSGRLLAKLCGNTLPVTYKSLGTAMYLRFKTDNSPTQKGFKAMYSTAVCGGTVYGQNGIIQSQGYPTNNYPDDSMCEWYFNGPTGHYLTIRFEGLDIQGSINCSQDFIEIREYNVSGRLLGTFCGSTIPGDMVTSDSFAYVKFVSDGSVNAKGFRLQYDSSVEECGGDYAGPSGTIRSPNYPNMYPHNRVCEWRITAPLGKRITLTLNDLRLEVTQNCASDSIAVYNGFQNQSPIIAKLCANVFPDMEVRSSGNTMKVVFVTDGSISNGGFLATYSSMEDAVCGGELMGPNGGNFTSPGFDKVTNYTKNLNCEWVIQNPNTYNSSTYISFSKLQLEKHQNCQNDFIELRAGNADGQLLARLCGQTKPRVPLIIVASKIWVRFVSNSEVEDIGFEASYLFTGCGGIQNGIMGSITSPNFPASYPSLSHCAWLLEAPEGDTITLSFGYFDVESHAVCRWDSVTIVNGASTESPVIGQYCGTTSPGTIQSGSNKLLVLFNSDSTIHGGGFYANWTSNSLGCGGHIHADTGYIKSPGWPQNFPSNVRCTWTIQGHLSSHFELVFHNNFNIPDSSGHCESSYVKVWSGADESQEDLLAVGCGNSAPAPVISQRSVIKVTFQSQAAPGSGFSASFISKCGANFTKSSGGIISPNYPDKYDNNLNCNYSIHTDSDTYIVLTFQNFELESSSPCKDTVKITSSTSPIATICGNSIPSPISTRGSMSINFYTNNDITMHGFMAYYRIQPCGGTFNASTGVLRSPTYAFTNYHNNMNCTYSVTVQENTIIELRFNEFDLEASSSCMFDYVAVYDGPNSYSNLIGKFCGNVLPPVIRTSSNKMLLVFITDRGVTKRGWRASYRQTLGPLQGCGGYLTNFTGAILSPDTDSDGKYDKNLDCVWNIAAPLNKQINLTFTSFYLEASSSRTCMYDFVKIFDGDSLNSTLQGTYCGSEMLAPFLSTTNFLTIWFHTDSSAEREGFNATYLFTDLLCGGIYNATSSLITTTSPNFPNSYPPFTRCVWTIDAPDKENVKLDIQTFHLPSHIDCSENYLEIKDSPQGDYGQVHKYCAKETLKIKPFYTYGRTAIVTFKSQEYLPGNGLSFTYQVANCNREYNQTFGYLKSPGWPGNYPHQLECSIILRAPENYSISLFFDSFNLETLSCMDYLEVRNGSDLNSPVIGKYCKDTLPNPIFSNNNVLHLFFKSDIIVSHRGYEITWTSSLTECGGTLFGDHGSFTSPGYPGTYSNSTDCEWYILAPLGKYISLNFASFSIDGPEDCEENYIKVYKGPDASFPLSGPFCGMGMNIAPINSTSHEMFIKFHSEYASLPSGFRLTWST
ncbi:cubilin [Pelobates cultripes]|uniref:Cubilin n=1 Tax=Pelobates cultripes TaxID=61616 RepID=A0AAD1RVX9_PELCU|nr:cubilin [Pelobates cultripes]